MKETIISFKLAELAKEHDFDWQVSQRYKVTNFLGDGAEVKLCLEYPHNWNFRSYASSYSAPTLSHLQKWFRKVHNIIVFIDSCGSESSCFWNIYDKDQELYQDEDNKEGEWDDVLQKGLEKAFQLIK